MTSPAVQGAVPSWDLTDRLVKARKYAGLKQKELALAAGISPRSVVNYEAGHTHPRRPELLAWAVTCGVSLAWLENGETPRPEGPDGGSELVRHQGLEPRTRWFGRSGERRGFMPMVVPAGIPHPRRAVVVPLAGLSDDERMAA